VVGDGVHIEARCVLKQAVVGRQCTIGRNVKLTNVVLMDRATVQSGCVRVRLRTARHAAQL
jgi:ADP-glucose pyrophosphorylase